MSQQDSHDFRPRRASSSHGWRLLIALLVALALAWWLWWRLAHMPAPPAENSPAAQVPSATPSTEGTSPASVSGTVTDLAPVPPEEIAGPKHPVEALGPADSALPPLDQSDAHVTRGLDGLLGGRRASDFLQLDGFVRRAVVTVDNLARPYAAARLWPVHPTAGRFTVTDPGAEHTTISPDNAARYHAFVHFAENVPFAAAVQLYARMYPLFQSAYEELGFRGRYFNDRVVAVLDLLIATPVPEGPVAVELTPVNGQMPTVRPWVRYEFSDPSLRRLSSGQKILVRMGPDNERRLQAVLRAVRKQVAIAALPYQKSD